MTGMRRRLLIDLNLTICVILGIFIFFLFTYKLDGGNVNPKDEVFSDGWTYEDGTPVDFAELRYEPDGATITKTVSPEQVRGADLCFESRSLFFTVYLDGIPIYDFHPDLLRIYGKYYGECIHAVDLPVLESDTKISITYESLYPEITTTFHYMKIQEGAAFVRSTVAKNFASYLECFVIMVLGVTLIIIGFVLHKETGSIIETVSLGTIAILLALWTSSGSRIPQLISENPAIVRVMDYLCLIFLPIPVIVFVASVTKQLDSIIPKIMISLVGINTVGTFIWVLILGNDYSDVLFVTHIIIAIGICLIAYMVAKSLKKAKKLENNLIVLFAAFGVLIAAGILDLIRYYMFKSSDSSMFTRLGLFYFVIVFTAYELSLFLSITRKSAQAEIKDKLAHEDGLTGLYNRLAFTETEAEIKKAVSGKYIVIQFDINFLKKVNDNYGHAEGDRYIIAAATIISDSFSEYGKCFRIGGDEFFVVLEGKKCEEHFEEGIKVFEKLVKEYNENNELPVPLQIAHGKSVYVPGKDSLEEAEKAADKLMYERKKVLKNAK